MLFNKTIKTIDTIQELKDFYFRNKNFKILFVEYKNFFENLIGGKNATVKIYGKFLEQEIDCIIIFNIFKEKFKNFNDFVETEKEIFSLLTEENYFQISKGSDEFFIKEDSLEAIKLTGITENGFPVISIEIDSGEYIIDSITVIRKRIMEYLYKNPKCHDDLKLFLNLNL